MSYAGGFPVFISHSANSEDRPIVLAFRTALRRKKFDPYIASLDVSPGRKLKDKVQANLERCRAVVVLLLQTLSDPNGFPSNLGWQASWASQLFPLWRRAPIRLVRSRESNTSVLTEKTRVPRLT